MSKLVLKLQDELEGINFCRNETLVISPGRKSTHFKPEPGFQIEEKILYSHGNFELFIPTVSTALHTAEVAHRQSELCETNGYKTQGENPLKESLLKRDIRAIQIEPNTTHSVMIHTIPENLSIDSILNELRSYNPQIEMIRIIEVKLKVEKTISDFQFGNQSSISGKSAIEEFESCDQTDSEVMDNILAMKIKDLMGEKKTLNQEHDFSQIILIYFREELACLNCVQFLGEDYNQNPFGVLHCIKIEEVIVIISGDVDLLDFRMRKNTVEISEDIRENNPEEDILNRIKVDPSLTKSRLLPSCIACLERLDTTISGLSKLEKLGWMALENDDRWHRAKSLCSVCSKLNDLVVCCMRCGQQQDNWICLICGYIGCGRYQEADALYHYENSGHALSMNIDTKSIWNYNTDMFVHRVEGKGLNSNLQARISSPGHKDSMMMREGFGAIEDDMELMAINSSFVVCEQLELQRQYFEQKILQVKETCMSKLLLECDQDIQTRYQEKERMAKSINDLAHKNKQLLKMNDKMRLKLLNLQSESEECESVKSNIKVHIGYLEENNPEGEKIEKQIAQEQEVLAELQEKLKQMYEQLGQNSCYPNAE